jgi:integrase
MAEPFKKNGKWYSSFKDRRGEWRYLVLQARSKAEARVQNAELALREERIARGLDQAPQENADATFAELLTWWLEKRLQRTRAYSRCAGTVRRHIMSAPLAKLPPTQVTPGRVDDFLTEKESELSQASVNHLRAYIRRAINAAKTAERFFGPNPVTRDVKKRRVPKRKPFYLKPEWIPAILDAVPDRWRAGFALGIYAGLRKGEIIALRKSDVDLAANLIFVRRSLTAEITKGGHEDGIPVADELRPYLEDAIANAQGELLFTRPDGKQHPENVDLVSILRTALRKAQIVTGYTHKCRRKGCGYQEDTADGNQRRCPKCSFKLWPVGKVLPFRFHDTRHTTASLLMMFGASPAAVQRILRHSDIRVTMDVYSHLAPGYLKSEINRLSFRPKPSEFTSPVLPGPETPDLAVSTLREKHLSDGGVSLVGAAGFEPTTSCSQSRRATSCATPRRLSLRRAARY